MATETLIFSKANPDVYVYKIVDGSNTYIVTHNVITAGGANIANAISIAIDYSGLYDRIADALETIVTNSSSLNTIGANLVSEVDNSGKQLTHIANHFKVERAVLVASDIKDEDKDNVKSEISSPSNGYGYIVP